MTQVVEFVLWLLAPVLTVLVGWVAARLTKYLEAATATARTRAELEGATLEFQLQQQLGQWAATAVQAADEYARRELKAKGEKLSGQDKLAYATAMVGAALENTKLHLPDEVVRGVIEATVKATREELPAGLEQLLAQQDVPGENPPLAPVK